MLALLEILQPRRGNVQIAAKNPGQLLLLLLLPRTNRFEERCCSTCLPVCHSSAEFDRPRAAVMRATHRGGAERSGRRSDNGERRPVAMRRGTNLIVRGLNGGAKFCSRAKRPTKNAASTKTCQQSTRVCVAIRHHVSTRSAASQEESGDASAWKTENKYFTAVIIRRQIFKKMFGGSRPTESRLRYVAEVRSARAPAKQRMGGG